MNVDTVQLTAEEVYALIGAGVAVLADLEPCPEAEELRTGVMKLAKSTGMTIEDLIAFAASVAGAPRQSLADYFQKQREEKAAHDAQARAQAQAQREPRQDLN